MSNVINIKDNTPYKGGFMPEPQDDWYSLYVDLQQDFDLISKNNSLLQRIVDNQKKDIEHLQRQVKELELDKKRPQEKLQQKRGWKKWIKRVS